METITAAAPTPPAPDEHRDTFALSPPGRVLLAVLSVGAGAIHLRMAPAHLSQWQPEGLAFIAAGLAQLGFAVAVVARPTRRLLQAGAVVNVLFVAAWTLTRAVGVPFGPESGHAETVSAADLLCVIVEGVIVVSAVVLAARPRLGAAFTGPKLAFASAVPAAVVVLLTGAALASPSASDHDHGDAAGAHGHDGTDDHGAGADDHHASAMPGMDHGDGQAEPAAPVTDEPRCDWEFNTQTFWKSNPPARDDSAHEGMGHGESHGAGAGEGVGNQRGVQAWRPMTDTAECAKMKADLAGMEAIAQRYPTLQSAKDAGCVRVTVYVPGIGSHWVCLRNMAENGLQVENPEMLLYGGNKPWAPLVGLSYYTYKKPATDWQFGQMPFHVHVGLCFKGSLVIGGDGTTKEDCEARGGRTMGETGFMGHYWMPSCSSPDGVFSADNPRLDLEVAQYNDDEKFNPDTGGDPSVLQATPCTGSKLGPDPIGRG